MKNRASIFEAEELDVSSFAPKASESETVVPIAQVRAIAEASQFPSREAPRPQPVSNSCQNIGRREPRRHRTGRTAQFNARTTPETVAAFYAVADRMRWLVGETLERALAALQRELGQG
jgi:hypothetical protein